MDKILVNIPSLNSFSSKIKSTTEQFSQALTEIHSVISELPSCCPASWYIDALNQCAGVVKQTSEKCLKLAATVQRCGNQFEACEKELASVFQDSEDENAAESRSNDGIWNSPWLHWLDNLLDGLGIDPYGRNYIDPGEEAQAANDSLLQEQISGIFTGELSMAAWEAASYTERQQMIRDVISRINAIQGTNITDIVFFDEGPQNGFITNGYYSDSSRSVHINMHQAGDFEGIMTTIVHEMRHAYQHAVTRDPDSFVVSEATSKSWSDNFHNYITAESDFNGYRGQPVEQDARDFSEGVDYFYIFGD